jgi:hypothetical protein
MSADDMPPQRVHLRINDAATGRPTPVRLRVTDAAGNYYAPYGRAAKFPTGRGEDVGGNVLIGRAEWTYIDGSCEIDLPPGELAIQATKGPEYEPLCESAHLPSGKLSLRFEIKRWTNQRESGWYSGDTRAHFLTPHAALLEAGAEDLAVVNLLACESAFASRRGDICQAYPNLLAFSGQQPCLNFDGHLVAVNSHNTHPALGRLALLHCHRVVFPLTFGGSERTDDWSLDDWCGQCHRKNGLVIWTDAFEPEAGHAGEALADLILGHVDALELDPASPRRLRAWYHVLNAGIRVPIVGGSAKDSNRTPLGAYRTYARLSDGEPLTYTAWIDAVRTGYTFVSAGAAFMTFDVSGVMPGGVVSTGADVRAMGSVWSQAEDLRAELVVNGRVAATTDGSLVDHKVTLPAGGWAAIRAWAGARLLAHSSPVYIGPSTAEPAAAAFVDGHLEKTRDWVVSEGRFEREKSRTHLLEIIDTARAKNAAVKRREPGAPLQ